MKRYDWKYRCHGDGGRRRADLVEEADGEWVLADEALARIAELEDALDTLHVHARRSSTIGWVLVPPAEWDAAMARKGEGEG